MGCALYRQFVQATYPIVPPPSPASGTCGRATSQPWCGVTKQRVSCRSCCARVGGVIPRLIETERLVLRPLRVSDAHQMVSVLGDASLYEFTGGEPPTLDELIDRYRRQAAGSNKPGEVWCNWIIRTKIDRRAVGFVQATVIGGLADVAWVIGVNDQGRGLASEAAASVCEWLTDTGDHRVEAHIHPHHVASQMIAGRIGLVRTGEFDDDGEETWAAVRAAGTCDGSDVRRAR